MVLTDHPCPQLVIFLLHTVPDKEICNVSKSCTTEIGISIGAVVATVIILSLGILILIAACWCRYVSC